MRAGFIGNAALEERMRRPDSTVRPFAMAQLVEQNTNGSLRAHTRRTRTEWGQADGAAAGPPPTLTGFSLLPEGDVRLADNITTLVTQTSHPDRLSDLNQIAPFDVVRIVWGGTDDAELEIARVKLWLNPRTGSPSRNVVKWICRLVRVIGTRYWQDPRDGSEKHALAMIDLCSPVSVAVNNDLEGEVSFDFTALTKRPQPKKAGSPIIIPSGWPGSLYATHPVTFVFVSAIKSDGTAATGVAMGYDSGLASSGSGNVVTGRHLAEVANVFLPAGVPVGSLNDTGSAGGTPYIKIETGTYATATMMFSTNPFNLGGAPAGDVQLIIRGAVPTGCALTGEIRNDADSGYVPFTDGQFMIKDLGLTPSQTRKMRVTLATNTGSGSSLTPTLMELGMEAKAEVDLRKLTRVTGGDWAIDPVTLKGEIPEITITVIRDGLTDYYSAIEELLSNNHIGDLKFAIYWADETLARKDWGYIDDVFIDASSPRSADVSLRCLSSLCFLRDFVPRYEPGELLGPDGDQSVGAWRTLLGGSTNLYQTIDETVFDDVDGVMSELTPSNSFVEFTFPTFADPTGRRHAIDYRFRKDAAGGEQIDLTVEWRQGGTVVASLTHVDITTDAALSCNAGSFSLTDDQIKLLTNYPDLRVRFTATKITGAGARRAVVTWVRLRTGGRRDQVQYPNAGVPVATLKAVYDDLIRNALAVDGRYIGPGVEDTTNQVAKVLFESSRDAKPIGKSELDAIAYIAGGGIISSQGKIKFVDIYGTRGVRAYFPLEEIRMTDIGPGYQERIPEFYVKWRWNPAKGDFDDEVRCFSSGALDNLGKARLAPPKYVDDEISKWISVDNLDSNGLTLAERIGIRQTQALGAGLLEWRFTSNYPYPELEPGDMVAVETDQFVARDPTTGRAIRGRGWSIGVISRCDISARKFSVEILSYADVGPNSENARRLGLGPATPHVMAVKVTIDESGKAHAVITTNAAKAVRFAASTSGMPSDATARAAALQSVDASGYYYTGDLLGMTPAQTVSVKVFAYENIDGSGLESPAGTATVKIGTRPRNFVLDDGLFILRAAEPTGILADDSVQLDPANGVSEGGSVYKLYRHREEISVPGADADGDVAVSFAQTYQAPPLVFFRGGQYLSYSSAFGSGVNHRQRFQALNITTSGFTSRTQLVNAGVVTGQNDDFPSGNLLIAVNDTAEADLTPGGANDDSYTVNYRVTVTNPDGSANVSLTLAIDINRQDANGWIQVASYDYSRNIAGTQSWNSESKVIVVTGLGTNDDIRVRAAAFNDNGIGGSFTIRAADGGGSNPDTRNGVTYGTASDTTASAIPSAGDNVVWVAQEVA